MNRTIYASFEDARHAQQAIGQLVQQGVGVENITLACRNLSHQVQASDLNPAQDDYPRTNSGDTAKFTSAPPSAARDYNRGLEADDYNTNYKGDVDRDMHEQRRRDVQPEDAGGVGPAPLETYEHSKADVGHARGSEPAKLEEADQTSGAMPQTFPDFRAAGPGNSAGDTGFGGFGTRYAGIAATANAASNPGGMSDFLWDSLPEDVAHIYQQQYDGGKAILIIREASDETEALVRRLGPVSVHHQGYLA